jgi:hypothetical protein
MFDKSGLAPMPQQARALLEKIVDRLTAKDGTHLDRGSLLAVLFEAQGGRLLDAGAEMPLHGTGLAESLKGAKGDLARLDEYLAGARNLSASHRESLLSARGKLEARVSIGERVQAAAATLGQNPRFQSRFEGVVIGTRRGEGGLLTHRLPSAAADREMQQLAQLLPDVGFEEFRGLLGDIGKTPIRGAPAEKLLRAFGLFGIATPSVKTKILAAGKAVPIIGRLLEDYETAQQGGELISVSEKMIVGMVLRKIADDKGSKHAVVERLPFVIDKTTGQVYGISVEAAVGGALPEEALVPLANQTVRTTGGGVYISNLPGEANSWEIIHADDDKWYPIGKPAY